MPLNLNTTGLCIGSKPILDATAISDDVASGKVFYNNNGRNVGTGNIAKHLQYTFNGCSNNTDAASRYASTSGSLNSLKCVCAETSQTTPHLICGRRYYGYMRETYTYSFDLAYYVDTLIDAYSLISLSVIIPDGTMYVEFVDELFIKNNGNASSFITFANHNNVGNAGDDSSSPSLVLGMVITNYKLTRIGIYTRKVMGSIYYYNTQDITINLLYLS